MKKVCELGHRKYLGMLSTVKTTVDPLDANSLYTSGQVNLDMGRSGTLGTGSGHRLATNFTFAPSSIDRCFGRLFWRRGFRDLFALSGASRFFDHWERWRKRVIRVPEISSVFGRKNYDGKVC